MHPKQNLLIGALIGIARASSGNSGVSDSTNLAVLEGLTASLPDADTNDNQLDQLIHNVTEEKRKLVPKCFTCTNECGRTSNYDMHDFWNAGEDIRALKSLLLFGICNMASYALPAARLEIWDADVNEFIYEILFALGIDDWKSEELYPFLLKLGKMNLRCIELLAQTKAQ